MNGQANGTSMAPGDAQPDLPSSVSPSLALVLATEEESSIIWTRNAHEWRGALSEEAYLQREKHLSSQDFTKDGGISIWILIDTNDSSRRILSSCETYHKKALVASNGTTRAAISHGIGSVFCPPEFRGHGYGGRMMREIGQILKTYQVEQEASAAFSILYSDIGKSFYKKLGWEPFNSSHVSIPATCATFASRFVRPLYAEHLPGYCAIDEQLVRRSLENAPMEKTFVALVPDIATIRWHHAREDFVAKEIHGTVPMVKGAVVGTEPGQRVWCYFNRMFGNADPFASAGNTLHILRIVVEEQGLFAWEHASENDEFQKYVPAIAALFRVALEQAREWNMESVEAWNPTAATLEAARRFDPSAQVIDRAGESIASLMWYGPRTTNGSVADEIEWLGDEKYGWC